MTTFIDFRYSRALAAALFAGQEKEETAIRFDPRVGDYVALDAGAGEAPRELCRWLDDDGGVVARVSLAAGMFLAFDGEGNELATIPHRGGKSAPVAVRLEDEVFGLRSGNEIYEGRLQLATASQVTLLSAPGTVVLGRGTGRARRWAELYYHRTQPSGLCVEITMDWHHLRAGIPLFSTMTAEELVAAGEFRLRFRSYAYEASDAEVTDFVRLFGTDDAPDIAMHLTPALYDPRTPGIPNLGFGVIETERVHPHLVDRCNRMDRVCVPSTFTRDAFQQNGVVRPIDVILHGVDTEYFRPAEKKVGLPGGSGFNFLAVGTHVERKNVKQLVRAFLEEFRSREDVALFLLLRPEYHTTQNNVALEFTDWEREYARDSANIFLWTGYLTREHLRDFYANADAYVMPSNEGFGLTLLEAMACGTPPIGLDHGGVVDFVNDQNGILVETGEAYTAADIDTLPYVGDLFYEPDRRALRDAMRSLFEDRGRTQRLGAQARADAERLAWGAVTAELSKSIVRTHAEFHEAAAASVEVAPLTIVLCVVDDADSRSTLDYLHSVTGVRVLCLFTRYARIADVNRARRHGFVYYRWDGTPDNAKVIARSIMGRSWILMIEPGERIDGSVSGLTQFLQTQEENISDVELRMDDGTWAIRAVHVRPQGESSGKTRYSGVSICRSPS